LIWIPLVREFKEEANVSICAGYGDFFGSCRQDLPEDQILDPAFL
jgi:hypothetical protein